MMNPIANLLATLSSSSAGVESVSGTMSTECAKPGSTDESSDSFENLLQALMAVVVPQPQPMALPTELPSPPDCCGDNAIGNSMQLPPPPPPLLPPPPTPPELTGIPSFEQLNQLLAQHAETAKTGELLSDLPAVPTSPSLENSIEDESSAKAILVPMMPPSALEPIALPTADALPAVDAIRASSSTMAPTLPEVPTPDATLPTSKVESASSSIPTSSNTDNMVSVGGWRDEPTTGNIQPNTNQVQPQGWEELNARVLGSNVVIPSESSNPANASTRLSEFSPNAPTNLPDLPSPSAPTTMPTNVPAPTTSTVETAPIVEPPSVPLEVQAPAPTRPIATADITAMAATTHQISVVSPGLMPPVVPILGMQMSELDPLGALRGDGSSPSLREEETPSIPETPTGLPSTSLPERTEGTRPNFSVAEGKSSPLIQAADGIIEQAHPTTGKGETEFHLRLDPPELGTIHVHLHTTADGTTTARLVISDESARRLIESQIVELRERLEAAGVKVGSCDVSGDDSRRGNRSPHPEPVATWTEAPLPPRNPRGYEVPWKTVDSLSTVTPSRLDVSV